MRLAEHILAPIEDQRQLAEIGGRSQRPGDGLPSGVGAAGHLIIERLGKAGFGHGGLAGHQELKLVPAQGLSFALTAQQLEPPRDQENAGVRGIDAQAFVIGGRWAGQGGHGQRQSGQAAKVHSSRLCHSDTVDAHGATPGGWVRRTTFRDFSRIEAFDTW